MACISSLSSSLFYTRWRCAIHQFTFSIECSHSKSPSKAALAVLWWSLPWKFSYPLPWPNGVGEAWCKWFVFLFINVRCKLLGSVMESQPWIVPSLPRMGMLTADRPSECNMFNVAWIWWNFHLAFSVFLICWMAFSWSADTLVDFSAISANASFLLAADALTYLSISLQVRRSSQRISASNALYQSHFALEAVAQSTLSVTSDLCAWRRSSFKYCILWTSLLSSGVHILLRRLGRQLINELYDQFELKECDDYHFYRIAY